MGNAQVLPNGNVVVGWGALPYVTEFHRGGGVRFDARLPAGGMNYRAFRLPWRGSPRDQPRLVSLAVAGRRRLHVSWNGATDVAAWRLEADPRPDALEHVLTRPRTGFETSLPPQSAGGVVVAVAVDRGAGSSVGPGPCASDGSRRPSRPRQAPTSSLKAGSSRIGSRSESSFASERSGSHSSSARRRCSIASAFRPARLSQQATL